ncbi:hypothetical protein SAMN05444162_3069 [Paenibacillaceae bacterium GAS479]|nr:hypothetical protein SAMN05444162_3069 [Paenibacillaceae bacterium GAS479]
MIESSYPQVLSSMGRLFSEERMETAFKSIAITELEAPKNKDDRSYWYNKSYSVFLRRFSETRPYNLEEEVWIERTAHVFSWIPRIPVVRLDKRAICDLAELEKQFQFSKLWEIGNESYLGGLNDPVIGKHHG